MNREIKFRAWDYDNKKMVYQSDNGDEYAWDIGYEKIYITKLEEELPQPTIKLMQYTGLKDKNGKEIYEGDVVQEGNRLWQVGFKDGCFVGVDFKNATWDELINIGYGNIEVIGNIYENPKLLEVKD